VATLAYLAIQILHNTVAQNAQSQRVISEGFRTVNLLLARDRELLNVMSRGNKDFAALDEEEAMAFSNYTASFLRTYEDAYSDHRRGVLEDSYWEARIGNLGTYISQQGFQTRVPAMVGYAQSWNLCAQHRRDVQARVCHADRKADEPGRADESNRLVVASQPG
jgi:hypothetical protein